MKIISIIIACLCLYGCATTAGNYLSKEIKIGMTQNQVYQIAGHPIQRSRQVINGHTYETWICYVYPGPYDFVDGFLTGYSVGYLYYSKDGLDNAEKSYKQPSNTSNK
jgi:hypothetical protein